MTNENNRPNSGRSQQSEPCLQSEQRLAGWVELYGQSIFGFIFHHVKDRQLAEDMTQDVYVRAWKSRERYQDQGSDKAFLFTIARRLIQDRFKKSKYEVRYNSSDVEYNEPSATKSDPFQFILDQEQNAQLKNAIYELSEAQRDTLLLRYFGDFSFAEIAVQLDCPINTVLSHCRRGLAKVKEALEQEDAKKKSKSNNKHLQRTEFYENFHSKTEVAFEL